jgi:uncharacterized membrane protein YkoI
MAMNRRDLLIALLGAGVGILPGSALAKSGGSGGGSGGSGGGDSDGKDSDGKDKDGGGKGRGRGRGRGRGKHADQAKARKASKSGKSKPISEIIGNVKAQYPGNVIGVKLNSGSWSYDVRIIDAGGRLLKVRVDAATGSILGVSG